MSEFPPRSPSYRPPLERRRRRSLWENPARSPCGHSAADLTGRNRRDRASTLRIWIAAADVRGRRRWRGRRAVSTPQVRPKEGDQTNKTGGHAPGTPQVRDQKSICPYGRIWWNKQNLLYGIKKQSALMVVFDQTNKTCCTGLKSNLPIWTYLIKQTKLAVLWHVYSINLQQSALMDSNLPLWTEVLYNSKLPLWSSTAFWINVISLDLAAIRWTVRVSILNFLHVRSSQMNS